MSKQEKGRLVETAAEGGNWRRNHLERNGSVMAKSRQAKKQGGWRDRVSRRAREREQQAQESEGDEEGWK